eukprot:4211473-Alexandrium_andersonii.AAC.1
MTASGNTASRNGVPRYRWVLTVPADAVGGPNDAARSTTASGNTAIAKRRLTRAVSQSEREGCLHAC